MTEFVEGWHKGRAVATGIGYTEGGTPQVAVLLRVNDDCSSGDGGRTITAYLYLSEKAAPYSIESLRAMGWTGSDLSELADADCETALPNDVSFPINYEEYNGKSSPKVGPILPATGGGIVMKSRLTGAEAKQFGMQFRGLCAAVPPKGGTKPSSARDTSVRRNARPSTVHDEPQTSAGEYPF
jgi:hypothetical protein